MKLSLCPWPLDISKELVLLDYLKCLGLSRAKIKQYCIKEKEQKIFKLLQDHQLELPVNLLNQKQISPDYMGKDIDIIYQDKIFLALNKPSGVHSYPLEYTDNLNCLSFLRHSYNASFFYNYPDLTDKGLLFRLDLETSGVLVFVKKPTVYREIVANREDLIKEKIYLTEVSGQCYEKGLIRHWLKPHGPKGSRMKAYESPGEGLEVAELEILENHYDELKQRTLLKVRLVTGRRHQIRVQLSAMGYPIVGDPLYGRCTGEEQMRLHASRYDLFVSGKKYSFYCDCDWD